MQLKRVASIFTKTQNIDFQHKPENSRPPHT